MLARQLRALRQPAHLPAQGPNWCACCPRRQPRRSAAVVLETQRHLLVARGQIRWTCSALTRSPLLKRRLAMAVVAESQLAAVLRQTLPPQRRDQRPGQASWKRTSATPWTLAP